MLRFVAANVVLACLLSSVGFTQGFCTSTSSIDEVPFFVGQTYADILNRTPDRTGQLLHIATLESANTTNCSSTNPTVAAGACEWNNNAETAMDFLNSAESTGKNGAITDRTAFVTALYQLLLRRAPDNTGLNYFLSLLNSGTTRTAVVSMFLTSPEYRKRFVCTYGATNPSCNGSESVDPLPSFVSQTFMDILDRPPYAYEQEQWIGSMTANQVAMCANTSASNFSVCDRALEAQTTLSFLEGSEYQGSNPPITNNGAFVTALYEHLLQRGPDAGGLQFYTGYLNQTSDRLGAIYGFLNSDEYRKRFACYAGNRDALNFGINGHPLNSVALSYSNSVGVNVGTQISLVQSAGLKWYRVDDYNFGPGSDYSQMDSLLSTAQAAGVQLLPVLIPFSSKSRAGITLADFYSESYSEAFDIVSRYKSSIHVWELSNEEDVYSLYGPGDPGWTTGPPDGDLVRDFYPPRLAISEAILHGLADGARAADPGCLRVINVSWLHTGFIEALENGIPYTSSVPYDIVGIHWYANTGEPSYPGMGDITCPAQGLPCPAQPAKFNVIERLQTLTNGKPLWVTENNYYPPMSGNSVATNISWEDAYLPPVLQMYLGSPSVYPYQMVMIYELLDEPYWSGAFFSQMGLYEVTESSGVVTLGAPKPAYQDVQQVLSTQ
jgi:Domain of unknown function (DUF4214)